MTYVLNMIHICPNMKHPHPKIVSYPILPSQKATLSIIPYHFTIIKHPNFYFTIQHIKIIFLHNKIIYPKTQIKTKTQNQNHLCNHLLPPPPRRTYPNWFLSPKLSTQIDFYQLKTKVIFKHIKKLPLSIPIHNVVFLKPQPQTHGHRNPKTQKPIEKTKPRNLSHRNPWPHHHHHDGNPPPSPPWTHIWPIIKTPPPSTTTTTTPNSITMNQKKNPSQNQIKPIAKCHTQFNHTHPFL